MDASTVEDHYRCILMMLLFIATAEAVRDGPQHDADQPGRGELGRTGALANLRGDGFDCEWRANSTAQHMQLGVTQGGSAVDADRCTKNERRAYGVAHRPERREAHGTAPRSVHRQHAGAWE